MISPWSGKNILDPINMKIKFKFKTKQCKTMQIKQCKTMQNNAKYWRKIMEAWFKSLSKKELRTWIKNMNDPLNMFLNSEQDNKNIEIAKRILKAK